MLLTKQNNAIIEPTLAMHSLMNVQRKTEPVTVQNKLMVNSKYKRHRYNVLYNGSTRSITLLVINTTQTKAVVAKRKLTIRDIQRAERERLVN